MLSDIGIIISAGEISNIIVKDHDTFHQEKTDIIKAGIQSSSYQHIDDTGARVKDTNQHFTVLCNDYFSAFFINPKKDRMTVIGILNQKEELSFLIIKNWSMTSGPESGTIITSLQNTKRIQRSKKKYDFPIYSTISFPLKPDMMI